MRKSSDAQQIDVVICKAKIQTADPYGEEAATKDQEKGEAYLQAEDAVN